MQLELQKSVKRWKQFRKASGKLISRRKLDYQQTWCFFIWNIVNRCSVTCQRLAIGLQLTDKVNDLLQLYLVIPLRLPTFAHLNFLLHQYGKIRAALKII